MNMIYKGHNQEADLICEALVREIARGPRWKAITEAWQALLVVRRMAEDMEKEASHIAGSGSFGAGAAQQQRQG